MEGLHDGAAYWARTVNVEPGPSSLAQISSPSSKRAKVIASVAMLLPPQPPLLGCQKICGGEKKRTSSSLAAHRVG